MSATRGETRVHQDLDVEPAPAREEGPGLPDDSATRTSPRELASLAAIVGAVVVLVVVGSYFASVGDQGAIGTLGLIEALPLGYFACLTILSLTFLWELLVRPMRERAVVLAAHVAGLVVLLHGAPALLEREPRFPTAWLHAGFVSQILEHHVAPGDVDARFNWPGFFGAAAAVTGAGGLDDALPFLRWAPVVMVLLYLLPVYVIGDHLTGSSIVTWLGLWLFVLVNWIGQDYFAPQSLAFLLYLTAIAILVTHFRELDPRPRVDGGSPPPLHRRRLRQVLPARAQVRLAFDGRRDLQASKGTRTLLIGVLLLIVVALAMTHQLTPIMLTLATGGLVLSGRCRLTMLPVVAGLATIVWISIGTTDYWVGHLHIIFGGLGDVSSVVSGSVGDRVEGSPGHLLVVRVRLILTAGVWFLMGVAAVRLTLQRRPPLTLFALATAPFVTLVQSYGGEGVLRVFLFSSPFAAFLIAQMTVPALRVRWAPELAVVVLLLMLPVFVLTRYGNETFEQVRANEVAALRTLYATAPQGSVFFSPTSQVPWRFEDPVQHKYRRPDLPDAFVDADPDAVRDPVSSSPRGEGQTYLVVTRSQRLYGREALGYPRGWFKRLRRQLTPENGYHLIVQNPDAWIYHFERQP
jgi:hypothetical protein